MNLFDRVYRLTFDGKVADVQNMVTEFPWLLDATNEDNESLLHAACGSKLVNLAEWLIERRAGVRAIARYGWTPLHYAVYDGDASSPKLVELLLRNGADPDVLDVHGFTPSEMAKRDMDEALPDVLRLLFASSRRYALPDMNGWPQLHRQLFLGESKDTFNTLRREPELIHTLSLSGHAPLHIACWARQLMIGVLVGNLGADVNMRGCHGRTPLHYAVLEEAGLNAVIVGSLLSMGANPTLKDDEGYLPEERARQHIRRGLGRVIEEFERAKKPRQIDFTKWL